MNILTPVFVSLGLCCLFIPPASQAQPIYRYQDENGRWHFSDKKPEKQGKVEEQPINASLNRMATHADTVDEIHVPESLCPSDTMRRSNYYRPVGGHLGKKGKFHLEEKGPENNRVVFAINDYFAPVTLSMHFLRRNQVKSDPKLPLEIIVPAQSRRRVAHIRANKNAKRWNYQTSHHHAIGDKTARHDNNCAYLAPVPADQHYRITQGFNGEFSHNSPYSRHSIDIAMPLGTPIVATRDGLVIARKTDFVLNGVSNDFKSRANALWILHGDGTISIYAHLQFRTIKVYEGERVRAGQVIGKSGNTGFSTGPHLHYSVVSNVSGRWRSLAFDMLIGGKVKKPKRGMMLSNMLAKHADSTNAL